MEIRTCACGCDIYVFRNVIFRTIEFIYDDPDHPITHCPVCHQELVYENLRSSQEAYRDE